jgi:hypothetical protein
MQNNKETPDFEIKKLNMLSFPTDLFPRCELTGNIASHELLTTDCRLVRSFIIK